MESLSLSSVQSPLWPMEQGLSAESSVSAVSSAHSISFIDNFMMGFGVVSPSSKLTGSFPNGPVSRMLVANLQFAVLYTVSTWLFTVLTHPREPPSLSVVSPQSTVPTTSSPSASSIITSQDTFSIHALSGRLLCYQYAMVVDSILFLETSLHVRF